MSRAATAPRMLSKAQAAAHCGLGVQTFANICPVPATVLRPGPNPILRWDRHRLDEWLDRIGGAEARSSDDWLERFRSAPNGRHASQRA